MQKKVLIHRYFSIPDVAILFLIIASIYSVVSMGKEWKSEFHPLTEIDLSISALPYYTMLSGIRSLVAYFISLVFTLIVGYSAAKSPKVEKFALPFIDILQSIPVLGFLPGLVLGLVALFPKSNLGLELAAILMIFTGQVWNMTLSFYSSLKSVPVVYKEAYTVIGLSRIQKLIKVELPFSAVNLTWNSLLSVAGGWFFLITCEAMTLGNREYRLPGIGSYMHVAIQENNHFAMVAAVIAMVTLILFADFVVWRPLLAWVQRFRLEEGSEASGEDEPLMKIWIRESYILRWIYQFYRDRCNSEERKKIKSYLRWNGFGSSYFLSFKNVFKKESLVYKKIIQSKILKKISFLLKKVLPAILFIAIFYGIYQLALILGKLTMSQWILLLRDTFWTLTRVVLVLVLSTLWALPVGIWIGISPKRVRFAQPIIQILASFPAPMLYPLVLSACFYFHIPFTISSLFLMLLGVQWYVLFNILAGALRIPQELSSALDLMRISRWDRWKKLYLPSVFPALISGWVTAAGGAWNASVVAEYIHFNGTILQTGGLGADLNIATAREDFTFFAGSLTIMVLVVVLLNRTVWARLFHLAQNRFRMEI